MPEWPTSPSVSPESLVEPGNVVLGRVAHRLRWYFNLFVEATFWTGVPNHLKLEPRPLVGWDGVVATPADRGPSIWVEVARSCLRYGVAPETLVEYMCRPADESSFAPSPEALLMDDMPTDRVEEIRVMNWRAMRLRAFNGARRFEADYSYYRCEGHDSESAIRRAIGGATKETSVVYRFGVAWRLNRLELINRLFPLAALEFACEIAFWYRFRGSPYYEALALQHAALYPYFRKNPSDHREARVDA